MEPVRVLICEDEGLTALRLRASLEALGFTVVGDARDGDEAVAKAARLRPDAILMDVNMPRLDGIEATRRIMEAYPTAIVMLTAHGDTELVQRALNAGAFGYLIKPVVDEQLRPAISVAWVRFTESVRQRQAALQSREASLREQELAEKARRRAEDARHLAVELRAQLRQERDVARALAESFLCPTPRLPGFDIASRYEPAHEAALVGGDYFDFIDLGQGRVGIVMGDVCGKGLAAASFTAMARYMLRAYAAEDPAPARTVERLNRALWERMSEECAFVTLVYGVLDLESGRFTYANAGHPPPVFCAPGSRCGEDLEPGNREAGGGCVLALLPDFPYEERTATIPEGGVLALFTDGVTEARSGSEMLGVSGVRKVVARSLGADSETVASAILAEARSAAGGELKDDVAIIVVRRDGKQEEERQ